VEIPFHRAYTNQDEIDEVIDAIHSGWLTMGPKTIQFEEQFKSAVRAKHAVSMNSCTAAMHLGLHVFGIEKNDEVIIPSMTFAATGEVVRYFGAMPVVVDVDRETHNIMPSEIEKHITPKTKAIIPVHFGGQPCDMDEIHDLAKRYNLKILEDAAHCFPSFYKGIPIGTFGDITAFSFYATKTVAMGEGGIATTENDEFARQMKVLRLHGISKDAWNRYSSEGSWYYEVVDAGFKYNMTDIQAALGLAQLRKSDEAWYKREAIAKLYTDAFSASDWIIPPTIKSDRQSSWHLYVIKLRVEALKINRAEFIQHLKEKGIHASVHFIPMYRHPYYNNLRQIDLSKMPNSEWLYERIISIPIFPGMSRSEVDYVIDSILTTARENAR